MQSALVDVRAELEASQAAVEEAQGRAALLEADMAALGALLEEGGAPGPALQSPAGAVLADKVDRLRRRAERAVRERDDLRKAKVRSGAGRGDCCPYTHMSCLCHTKAPLCVP